jgi:hypothetical protein
MATKKAVERYRSQSKWFWNSIFYGIPSVVIGYWLLSNLFGDHRHLVGGIFIVILMALILRKWHVTQTFTRASTPYEDMEAEYTMWLVGEIAQSNAREEAWHRGEISYDELVRQDRASEERRADARAALERFRTEKLSNNVIVYHDD